MTNIILVKSGVLVIYNSRASDVIKNNGTSSSSVASFNGDDALVLKNNDTVIDVIGLLGEDPGKGWAVAGIENATQNHTLVRKSSVVKGSITWDTSAGTTADNSQWEVKEQDDFSSVGKK
ncbi:Probable lipoprotein precursor (fragment) [Tenacibaculum finnmarkense]